MTSKVLRVVLYQDFLLIYTLDAQNAHPEMFVIIFLYSSLSCLHVGYSIVESMVLFNMYSLFAISLSVFEKPTKVKVSHSCIREKPCIYLVTNYVVLFVRSLNKSTILLSRGL